MSAEGPEDGFGFSLAGYESDGLRAELRDLARSVADRTLAPHAARWDEESEFPDAAWHAPGRR